jgi:hypothetical protein
LRFPAPAGAAAAGVFCAAGPVPGVTGGTWQVQIRLHPESAKTPTPPASDINQARERIVIGPLMVCPLV